MPLPEDLPKRVQSTPKPSPPTKNSGPFTADSTINDFGRIQFLPGKEAAAKGLPGFRLVSRPDGTLPQLPSVQVPFGLDLGDTQVTDAGLKELKELKNLTLLDLGGTQVTDAGLKELKDLKNLTSLDLGGTQVTDAGLKELKDLKNLTSLDLAARR